VITERHKRKKKNRLKKLPAKNDIY